MLLLLTDFLFNYVEKFEEPLTFFLVEEVFLTSQHKKNLFSHCLTFEMIMKSHMGFKDH